MGSSEETLDILMQTDPRQHLPYYICCTTWVFFLIHQVNLFLDFLGVQTLRGSAPESVSNITFVWSPSISASFIGILRGFDLQLGKEKYLCQREENMGTKKVGSCTLSQAFVVTTGRGQPLQMARWRM